MGAHARHGRVVEYWLPEGERPDSTDFHRDDGPAITYADGSVHWFNQGNLHRDDGPAISTPDGSLQYFVRGVCHRENGPAIEGNGQREWQTHGSRHRDDGGPAVIVERNGLALYWFLEGEQHRDDGPALIRIVTDSLDVIRAYWLEGEEVSEQVWRQYCEDEPDLRIWDQDGWLSPASQVLVSSAGLRTTSTVTN